MINETQQIEKLTELNDDLENYFRNTIIPQLYVDGNLILRKFTPPAMKQFNLSTGDIGKSIIDIIDNFRLPTIIENIHQVITSNEIFEKELQTTDLRWYQMNLIPYIIKKKNQTDGVIMTFVEITMRIKDLEEQEKLIAKHENLLHTISHDIRSPIGNLMLTMDLFKNNLFEDQKQHFSLIETAKKSLMKMRNVIDELTEDLRKQKDKHASEQELSDFQGVLEDVKLSISHHIADSGAVIRSKIGVQKLAIPRSKLRSLIYNLLSNAIKY